jgi:drug/metabolite transporter (DMT)-like permease
VVAGNVLALALTAPVFLPLAPPRALDWAALAWLGVVQIALAYALLASGMRRVGALETSLLLLLEPVLSPLWAWLVHGERMGPASLAGGALILGAGVARTAVAGRRRPPRAEPRRRAER